MKLPRLFLILQVTDELKRMNHQDESRWPRQAATGAWSSRKCEYPSPVLHKRYQIWVTSAVYWWSLFEQPDERWAGLCDKTQRERAGRRAGCWGRRSRWPSSWTTVSWTESWFPVKFLWTDISWCISFRSLWTAASPAQRHGLCTFIQANFSAAFTEEQQEAPWLETWLKRQKGTEVTATIPSGYRAASFFKCTSRRVIRLQMTITNRRACYIG